MTEWFWSFFYRRAFEYGRNSERKARLQDMRNRLEQLAPEHPEAYALAIRCYREMVLDLVDAGLQVPSHELPSGEGKIRQ